MLLWAVGVAFGLGAMFTTFPISLILLKFVGGGYLLWLAAKALRSTYRGDTGAIATDAVQRSSAEHWRRGFFVVLTNPKAALMWAAVATFLFGADLATWQVALFGPVGATSGFLIYGSYAMLFSTRRMGGVYRRFTRGIEATLELAFGTFGAKLIFDGSRALHR